MLASFDCWSRKGKYRKVSPCARYQVEIAILAGRKVYYGLPSPRAPYLGPARETAEEAWRDCFEHSVKERL